MSLAGFPAGRPDAAYETFRQRERRFGGVEPRASADAEEEYYALRPRERQSRVVPVLTESPEPLSVMRISDKPY